MSKAIQGILLQIRSGKSSLLPESLLHIEPSLAGIDNFLSSNTIPDEELFSLIETLKHISERSTEELSLEQESTEVSTRINNIAGWEAASLVGLVCTHHVYSTTRAKLQPSAACMSMYIGVVDFLLAHPEARCRAHAATFVRSLSKSFIAPSGLPSGDRDREAEQLYMKLYAVILRHAQQHLSSRPLTRPVLLGGEERADRSEQQGKQQLELDDLRCCDCLCVIVCDCV